MRKPNEVASARTVLGAQLQKREQEYPCHDYSIPLVAAVPTTLIDSMGKDMPVSNKTRPLHPLRLENTRTYTKGAAPPLQIDKGLPCRELHFDVHNVPARVLCCCCCCCCCCFCCPWLVLLSYQLINKGANLNAKTRIEHTPLHLACRYGHYNIALALLVKGAEVDSRDNELNTPLHKASRWDAMCDDSCRVCADFTAVRAVLAALRRRTAPFVCVNIV